MKKKFTLFIILFSVFSNSQNYKFNLVVKYTYFNDRFNSESIVYGNSQNSDYFLKISDEVQGTTAFLYDLKVMIKHEYKVLETKLKNGETELAFIFNKSNVMDSLTVNCNHNYEFEERLSEGQKTVVMHTFKKNKKTKERGITEITFSDYKENLFPLFRFSCLHGIWFCRNISIPIKGIVKKAVIKVNGNKKMTFNLSHIQKVDFELKTNNPDQQ